ncbi:MAG: outer membrane lipoprotein-sorting protein [Deltaproteobacteria bacterium]|nr:outer membrane lipoprotein-sorting protein [Deltaproteobacteria bacterium]
MSITTKGVSISRPQSMAGFKEIKGIWTIARIMVETPRKGSKTLMQYDSVDYNIGLLDALFEQSNLKR